MDLSESGYRPETCDEKEEEEEKRRPHSLYIVEPNVRVTHSKIKIRTRNEIQCIILYCHMAGKSEFEGVKRETEFEEGD